MVVALLAAAGLGYLGYTAFVHSEAGFLTVSQFSSQAESLVGRQSRVGGVVVPGTIKRDAGLVNFTLAEGGERINVTYQGTPPDEFGPGREIIIEGRYSAVDVFEATAFGASRSVCNICH
ncbi:MAG: cytochrome c maturation protein CcmE [Chloroflexi bacterium]|nr:cytochrome c maturation protein CcmE [Chloroflexota bacterium]